MRSAFQTDSTKRPTREVFCTVGGWFPLTAGTQPAGELLPGAHGGQRRAVVLLVPAGQGRQGAVQVFQVGG